jgi:hypothetical protein
MPDHDEMTDPHLRATAPVEEKRRTGLPERPSIDEAQLRHDATALAGELKRAAPAKTLNGFTAKIEALQARLGERLRACKAMVTSPELTPARELLESGRMLESALIGMLADRKRYAEVPLVAGPITEMPRIVRIADRYIATVEGIWSLDTIRLYMEEVQRSEALPMAEILLLPGSMKLAQVELLLDVADAAFAGGAMPTIEDSPLSGPIHSLRRMDQTDWHDLLEGITVFHRILSEDPAHAYAEMDEESRVSYRMRVAELAHRASSNEVQTATTALHMAQAAAANPVANARLARRMSHVGYYLFEEGFEGLSRHISYFPPPAVRIRMFVKRHAETIYVLGIFVLSTLLIAALIAPLVPHNNFTAVIIALLLSLLPASVGASDLINSVVTAMFPPQSLPKLDYRKFIPMESTTLVVVPTLLLSEDQVRETFDELEARYLSNPDANLHFGLLTDLPDSQEKPEHEDKHRLVEMAVACTNGLNEKYRNEPYGRFLLLHRHRIYNARQRVWMGWERKRGKLLDLNKLLLGAFDSFPIKAGPLEILRHVRYVITLDSDTQLPRGSAARMVGAIAHPLNQAIVNPQTRIVDKGYGILQPRVGVSVGSASRSRLAALYSGETGFDIYTRAVSDVYQDLFGEGIFTGKGIYEVAILHEVLDRRFPRDSLLSHDLIEGAYARAGLATDIEVIDDYPSHYSAHTRRKHRWLRGDWQIVQWLSTSVPDESGRMTPNPISMISQWKMLDNLRRSLIEPVTFLLFVLGWCVLPGGPFYWTFVLLTLLLLPAFVQFGFNLGRAAITLNGTAILEAFGSFFASLGFHFLNLAFLAHQTLLSLDAIIRSLVRRFLTGERLLEWETAAESEANRAVSTLDLYLQLSPAVAFAVAIWLTLRNPVALLVASPILILWVSAAGIAGWLDSPPRKLAKPLSRKDESFLEEQALLVWRYFSEFGGAENHWLIPDNVEEKGAHQVRTLSPTNLGMVINARQAAERLGFLTLPEFAEATLGTLTTYERLEKFNGHIFNWYNIETLQAMQPRVVSTVDSGNLMASLYALHGGALDLLKRPLLGPQPFRALARMLAVEVPVFAADTPGLLTAVAWLTQLDLPDAASWKVAEGRRRRDAMLGFVTEYLPWLLPRFTPLFGITHFHHPENEHLPSLQQAAVYVRDMSGRLSELLGSEPESSGEAALIRELLDLLSGATDRIERLRQDVERIAAEAIWHADAMHYGFLFVEARQLLSIAYDDAAGEINSACYDLLASEARIASFLAVAKGDIPQRSWFNLGRTHTIASGRAVLISWTGTMFEYLMPALWMKTYPDTLITRSLEASIAVQRRHVRGIPWGISESGFAKTDPQGRYSYQAWGIPALALKYEAEDGPVISPYSSFLAMAFARADAIANLQRMAALGWVGAYGFYEAADYTQGKEPQLVRSWMAHHQGMSLLAVTNLLAGNVFQQWFHANPRVRAAELLLHERPLSRQALKTIEERLRTAARAAS